MWISLIGFMGSGKSTVAELIARRAVLASVDLDVAVAEAAGADVPEIFAAAGEAGFREAEARALVALPADGELVVAAGGGVVEREANRTLLRERGTVVWLDLPWEAQRARLEAIGTAGRPLLQGGGWGRVESLHRRRRPLYARTAHFRLRGDLASEDVLVRQVMVRHLARQRQLREDGP